ncbi:solute carrier family 35 member C2 isoform X2 [Heterocephalus glaber]|uniref:Solute carrier family 35 member C2 isoform X2 n=1 Tax=Heterocephalus glaber TaxID=10181 RepID=A0AAX6RFU5_HETGA|nr:solute carrier family 35 member C2 isoform X2 [Heterocephalus glaber]
MGRWALDLAFVWKAVFTLGLVLLYYCFSIGITFYNKWLTKVRPLCTANYKLCPLAPDRGRKQGKEGQAICIKLNPCFGLPQSFHFPLFMTMLHLAVIFLFSALSRALVQCSSHRARVVLSWTDYLRRVAPTALATALDVGLSNWSFLYITVSLVQHWSWWSCSLLEASSCSPTSLPSSTWRALPWCWQPRSLVAFAGPSPRCSCRRPSWVSTCLQNPIDTMFHLQPLMFLGLFPLFAVFEGLHLSTSEKIFRFQDTGLLLRVLGSLFLGGILAFGLGFSEFLLVSRTSSLTLSIAGIFKEVCTLLLAAHLLGDHITLVNWLGFALCLSGISLHVALKVLHSRGSSGSKPLKSLGSSPDMELLLRTSQQEDEDNEEE